MRSGPGEARTILLFIPLVLGPLNSLVWYVPSLRYTRGLGWRMHCVAEVTESSTNNNIISLSDEFRIGESQGRPSHELRRGRQSSP